MSIDDHIEAIRQAYKRAQQTGSSVYVADASGDSTGIASPDSAAGNAALGPMVFMNEAQLKVTPDGRVLIACDGCGLGLSPLEHTYGYPSPPRYPADDPTV